MVDSLRNRSSTVSDTILRLEQHLTCAICLERYQGPKTLPCHHSFCQVCLEHAIINLPLCPSCRKPVVLPDGGVASLPPAFLINNFLEIHSQLKDETGERCTLHERPLEAFCRSCSALVCLVCTATTHKSHNFELTGGIQDRLMTAVEKLREKLSRSEDTLAMLDHRETEILDQELAIKHQILFVAHMEQAEKCVRKLLDELALKVKQKLAIIGLQRRDAQQKIKQLQECYNFVQTASTSPSLEHLFAKQDDILQQISLTMSAIDMDELQPAEDADIVFVEEVKVMPDGSKQLGKFKCLHLHHKCQVLGLKKTIMMGEHVCDVMAYKDDDTIIPIPAALISCEFKASHGLQPIKDCFLKQAGPGRFKISYTPRAYGPHQLRILVGISDVPGSPFTCIVPQPAPLERGQQLCSLSSRLEKPGSVAVSSKTGLVVVAEWGLDCITVLDTKGRMCMSFGSLGSKAGKFNCPWSVALIEGNQIVVTDHWNDRIQVFTMEGKHVESVGSKGMAPLHFGGPKGIAIAPSGDIFVAESCNSRIQALTKNLHFCHIFLFDLDPPFNPSAMAVDEDGILYIADRTCHCVCKYTQTGQRLATIGRKGSKPGELKYPAGIAIDSKQHIYISEEGNHRVSVFTTDGQFIHCFGRYGEKENEFKRPLGIAIDSSSNVYVCDSGNNRLCIF